MKERSRRFRAPSPSARPGFLLAQGRGQREGPVQADAGRHRLAHEGVERTPRRASSACRRSPLARADVPGARSRRLGEQGASPRRGRSRKRIGHGYLGSWDVRRTRDGATRLLGLAVTRPGRRGVQQGAHAGRVGHFSTIIQAAPMGVLVDHLGLGGEAEFNLHDLARDRRSRARETAFTDSTVPEPAPPCLQGLRNRTSEARRDDVSRGCFCA